MVEPTEDERERAGVEWNRLYETGARGVLSTAFGMEKNAYAHGLAANREAGSPEHDDGAHRRVYGMGLADGEAKMAELQRKLDDERIRVRELEARIGAMR